MKYLSPFFTFNHRTIVLKALVIFMCFSFVESCNSHQSSNRNSTSQKTMDTASDKSKQMNTLAPQEKKEGWKLLFNGKTLDKWRGAYQEHVPRAWQVKNGVLRTMQASNRKQGGGGGSHGSIVTKKAYKSFIFALDFKLTEGANTGIKYFVVEDPDFFEGDPRGRAIGLEYQLVDDGLPVIHPTNSTGSLYAMIPPDSSKKHLNPLGQWNHAKIVSKGCHVEHWLNGKKLLEYRRDSKVFGSLVAESKYFVYEDFGLAPQGHILLQDHGTKAFFRNIKIKNLNKKFNNSNCL